MGVSLPSRRVIRVLSELVALHGCPSALRVDNGPEFTAQPFVGWCAEHRLTLHDIQPGKPDQNASSERFNRSYRTEVPNAHLFESLAALRTLTDAWLRIYNGERPHDSLGRVPPLTFLPRPSSGAFPISRSRAHTHRRHGHPLQTVPSAGLIERPQEKNRVDALR